MFAHRPLPRRHVRAPRAAAGGLGILLLLLQLLSPALASAEQGVWMEICSEAGAVWVQVDPEDGTTDTAPCPKCAHCALCAVTGAAPLPDLPGIVRSGGVQIGTWHVRTMYKPDNPAQFWPDSRGPPPAPQDRTERAPRASMASIQVTGGAPWS
ncbi:MAG: hypothetical protein AB3N22_15200 [Ruegeria sp.]